MLKVDKTRGKTRLKQPVQLLRAARGGWVEVGTYTDRQLLRAMEIRLRNAGFPILKIKSAA